MEATAPDGRRLLIMRFVKVEWNDEWRGYLLDPSAYQAELPSMASSLPPGAAEYATENGHYDFGSPLCVKDLWLSSISTARRGEIDLEIRFDPYEGKHNTGLMIEYAKVSKVDVAVSEYVSGLRELGNVLLDEILPSKGGGCSHEIALVGGAILVECADLEASWTDFISNGNGAPR